MSPYRILSLDGGGIKGVLTAVLLKRIEAAIPGFLGKIDLFAGTSTGGILALGLAFGLTPEQCGELYEAKGSKVFERALPVLHPWLFYSKFGNDNLKWELTNQFADKRLSDLLPRRVLVCSFDLDNEPPPADMPRTWKPKFFHNFPEDPKSDGNEKIVDVALRTSAAPTFFPVYQGFVDGGVVANNPSMCAVAQALHPSIGKQKLEDIALLSIGTGWNAKRLEAVDTSWGLLPWARAGIVELLIEGTVDVANYQCRQILGGQYFRLNPTLSENENISLDRVDLVPRMIAIAQQHPIEAALAWIKAHF
jgi:patatin-like phospholipase/acyl hydrolase